MNKKIITLALALLFPLTLMAAAPNDQGDHQWRHADRLERLTKELSLSADQQSKLEAIFKQQQEKFKALHEEKRKLIEGVLTKEQIAKFDELKKQRREEWQKRHQQGHGQNPPAHL